MTLGYLRANMFDLCDFGVICTLYTYLPYHRERERALGVVHRAAFEQDLELSPEAGGITVLVSGRSSVADVGVVRLQLQMPANRLQKEAKQMDKRRKLLILNEGVSSVFTECKITTRTKDPIRLPGFSGGFHQKSSSFSIFNHNIHCAKNSSQLSIFLDPMYTK